MNFSRRTMLKGLGASALYLPWLRPALGYAAGAAAPPKRLLIYWAGSGVDREAYTFTSASGGAPTETDFVFPSIRAPLNAIKSDLIALANVDMVSATKDPTDASNAHYAGETHSLAATNRLSGDTAGGVSIDQYIAQALNANGPVTKFPSLTLSATCDANLSYVKVCTPGPGQVISFEPNPRQLFNNVFNGLTSTGPSPEDLLAQKKSVLDLVLKDFSAVRSKLGKSEQAKLDTHAQMIRDLEQRLTITGSGCQVPSTSILTGTGNAYPGDQTLYDANFDAMTRIIQASFACDLTRVVLFFPTEPPGSKWGYTVGDYGTSDAHDLTHKTSYNGAGILKTNPDAMAAIGRLHQTESQQFMHMLDLLRQVQDTDGSTLLDNTVVLWCSQIGEHGHDLNQLPWILAGGKAAGFRTGRYVDYGRTSNVGVPHNDLFVTIAQAMGVPTSTFGNPAVCRGPLPRLRS